MASTYSTSLRLELMATGDQSGTWGDTTNTNLGTLLEQAITGVLSVAQGDVANLTLTTVNGGSDQARNAVVNLTGALTAQRNVVVQTANKLYLIKNSTTGGFSVVAKTAAGSGVTIAAGTSQWVYSDGTNVVRGLIGNGAPDASGNISANNFLAGFTTTATAAGTTTLTAASTELQYFTGSTTQTITLPVVSTMVLGQEFEIVNLSSGALTVNSSGANLVSTVAAGGTVRLQVILVTGTSAASWNAIAVVVASASTSTAGIVQLATNAQALAGTSTTLGLVPGNLLAERQLGVQPVNLSLTPSVAGNALTIALKGVDGNDPSATNPVVIPFRNVTAATGTPTYLTATAATSIVISPGSTMGFTSAVAGRLWIVAFNDAGTLRLGAITCTTLASGVLTQYPLAAFGIASSTAEGGAGAADSAQTFYTGTAVTSKAYTVLGYCSFETGVATAGTWAAAPTRVQIYNPSVLLPGVEAQTASNQLSGLVTGATTTPVDDTIPQSGEGNQILTQAITPSSAANVLLIDFFGFGTNSTATAENITTALFQDSTANALAARLVTTAAINYGIGLNVNHQMIAATTSSTTFKVRVGAGGATINVNGIAGGRLYGGVASTVLRVRELSA